MELFLHSHTVVFFLVFIFSLALVFAFLIIVDASIGCCTLTLQSLEFLLFLVDLSNMRTATALVDRMLLLVMMIVVIVLVVLHVFFVLVLLDGLG